jgi:hypothetical protein
MDALYAVLAVVAILGVTFAILFRQMASRFNASVPVEEWLMNFSADSYAPMERLLDERDFIFLAEQPGYDRRIARQLRSERKEVFKGYLRRLVCDFNQLLRIAKFMIVYGSSDQGEFAKSLWRQQLTFYCAVYILRCRLAMYPLITGAWDVGRLIGAVQVMRSELRHLAPPVQQIAIG